MTEALVIRGRYVGRAFLPDEPLPAVEGTAELIVFPSANSTPPAPSRSVFDLFGTAPRLRTGEEIAGQVQEERDAWGEP